MIENFADLFEESLKVIETRPGSIVKGTIVCNSNKICLVDAGLKSEAAIPVNNLRTLLAKLKLLLVM